MLLRHHPHDAELQACKGCDHACIVKLRCMMHAAPSNVIGACMFDVLPLPIILQNSYSVPVSENACSPKKNQPPRWDKPAVCRGPSWLTARQQTPRNTWCSWCHAPSSAACMAHGATKHGHNVVACTTTSVCTYALNYLYALDVRYRQAQYAACTSNLSTST